MIFRSFINSNNREEITNINHCNQNYFKKFVTDKSDELGNIKEINNFQQKIEFDDVLCENDNCIEEEMDNITKKIHIYSKVN